MLRSLADLPWSASISRWLELGYVTTQAGRVVWQRPDLADTLSESLPEEQRRIVHRAWTEYWGSFSPEPGSPEARLTEHFLVPRNWA